MRRNHIFCFPFRHVPGTVRGFSVTRNLFIFLISCQHYNIFISIEHAKVAGDFLVVPIWIRKHI
jgi:hypothetical protein